MAPTGQQAFPAIIGRDEIIVATTRQIEETRKLVEYLITSFDVAAASFDTIIKPLIELENAQSGERAVIAGLKYFSPSPECQRVASEAEDTWRKFETSVNLDLYALLDAVRRKNENLCVESRKLLDRMLLEYEKSGYRQLDEAGLQDVRHRNQEIDCLQAEYHQNLRRPHDHVYFDKTDLAGLPDDLLAGAIKGERIAIGLNKHFTVMRSAHNPETRRRMQEGYHHQHRENITLFHKVVVLRDENAQALSFPSHAATKLSHRCVESLQWVEELIADLTSRLIHWSETESKQLLELKQRYLASHLDIEDHDRDQLMPWDYIYYSSLLQKEARVKHTKISEYFPLDHTLGAMLQMFGEFLELRFAPIAKKDLESFVWHKDVTGWTVWETRPEKNNSFVGYLFTDFSARPHKYRGNQSVNIQPVSTRSPRDPYGFYD